MTVVLCLSDGVVHHLVVNTFNISMGDLKKRKEKEKKDISKPTPR